MPIIQGVDFEQRELEYLAEQRGTNVDSIVNTLLAQPEGSVPILKRTVQQLLSTLNAQQGQQVVVEDNQTNNPLVETYTPPVNGTHVVSEETAPPASENVENWQPYTPPRQEPAPDFTRTTNGLNGSDRVKEITQKVQDALFTALAKVKTVANNIGDRWLGGKNRSPIETQSFSINPLKESFINPLRNVIIGLAGYVWLNGVVQSSSTGIASVLEDTNAFSAWASLSAIQIAAMLLFLELVSDLSAIAKKVKNGELALAGQKLTRDMVQNTLYFFAIYEFNQPWQILMITLGNIFVVEKFLEEKLFHDSFATHARTWRVRMEPYLLILVSLVLSTNKTLGDISLANASRFTSQDLLEIPVAKAKEEHLNLNPEKITSIHEYPMKLSTGEYLYIVETAEKQMLLNDTGEKAFRVVSEYPISSPADFGLMSLTYFKLKKYTPPANASKILETVGNIDAYNQTLIVRADRGVRKKKKNSK